MVDGSFPLVHGFSSITYTRLRSLVPRPARVGYWTKALIRVIARTPSGFCCSAVDAFCTVIYNIDVVRLTTFMESTARQLVSLRMVISHEINIVASFLPSRPRYSTPNTPSLVCRLAERWLSLDLPFLDIPNLNCGGLEPNICLHDHTDFRPSVPTSCLVVVVWRTLSKMTSAESTPDYRSCCS